MHPWFGDQFLVEWSMADFGLEYRKRRSNKKGAITLSFFNYFDFTYFFTSNVLLLFA
jgi:hypothetical protein